MIECNTKARCRAPYVDRLQSTAALDSSRHHACSSTTTRALVLTELRTAGCETVLDCYWVSATGHGGPMLWAEQLGRLAEYGLELWFDVYF